MFVHLRQPFEERRKAPPVHGRSSPASRRPVGDYEEAVPWIGDAHHPCCNSPRCAALALPAASRCSVEDQRGAGLRGAREGPPNGLVRSGAGRKGLGQRLQRPFNTKHPAYLSRRHRPSEGRKPRRQPIAKIFNTLQTYLGSTFVNDFNFLGRTFEVLAQADGSLPSGRGDHQASLKTRSSTRSAWCRSARLSSLTHDDRPLPGLALQPLSPPPRKSRATPPPELSRRGPSPRPYGEGSPRRPCRAASDYEWTELAYQQKRAKRATPVFLVFALSVVFVFLVLAALYESVTLPLVSRSDRAHVPSGRHARREPHGDRTTIS